jgi:hypothetical protein
MAGSIKNWPGLVQRIFDHLKPGGWAEFSDYDINLKSQDNTIPKDYKPQEMLNFLNVACVKIGRPLGVGPKLKGMVEETGFTNVRHEIIPLPLGIWPKDQKLVSLRSFLYLFSLVVSPRLGVSNFLEDANIWRMQKAMGAFMTLQYTEGVDGFTKLPYTQILGWSSEEVDVFNAKVRAHVKDRTIHVMHE